MLEQPQTSEAQASFDADHKVTPSMAQYIEIKAANPDSLLFYRMGDFYELFFEDAEIASRTLGIVLTKRGKHSGQDIPMCGVPVIRADEYLQRLIAAGHRVAVCEQLEDPAEARKRGAKAVVRRDVVRLVTAGTITEEALLEPQRASTLLALGRVRQDAGSFHYGLAEVDITTGRFVLSEVEAAGLAAEISRIDPREIVVPDAIRDDLELASLWRDQAMAVARVARDGVDSASAEGRIAAWFGVTTLDGYGQFGKAALVAGATALSYIERTQRGQKPLLMPPSGVETSVRRLSGERVGSLLHAIDRTITPAGGRLLAERLAGPLTDLPEIRRRHEAIRFFRDDSAMRRSLRQLFHSAPDMARSLTRLALDRGGPRDLAAIRDGALLAAETATLLRGETPDAVINALQAIRALPSDLPDMLAAMLSDTLPLQRRDGGFIEAGVDAALDEMRTLRDDSRRVIAGLQQRYADEAEARTLRIKHTNFLGYFVEVPQKDGERFLLSPLNATFIHRQTMQGAMRFSTAELGEMESRIASAGERALAIEQALFDQMRARILAAEDAIQKASAALATLDVAAALADLAVDRGWTEPVMESGLAFRIRGGRHPVVEEAVRSAGQSFIANDAELSPPDAGQGGGRLLVVTGPNMAGKSTFLRQNALIVVLAQMGSFVPAEEATIGVVDRLFSRVGAADDLARGRSTFMVEMVETAAILNQATERSLVILDEIGRGTATFDGLSIAWAAIEHLHEVSRCRALFATHYHELTALSRKLSRLGNVTMRVTDHEGEVIFLHEVVQGAADRSYGIQVARLAGLPPSVIERAKVILSELEKTDRQAPVDRMLGELPLFAALPVAPPPRAAKVDHLRLALSDIHPDEMTPKEAMEALYRLKGLG
jgi:DNA mismatch repair protein MutS